MAEQFDLAMNGLMHRAFLRDFERIANAVRTDRWEAASKRWTLVCSLLHHHHRSEDDHLWPAMLSRITDPQEVATVEAMEAEHALLAAAIAACESDFGGPRPATTEQRKAVESHVRALADVLHRHTAHEESDGEPLVQRYVTPKEFKTFAKSARNSPDRMVVMPWIADGAPPEDVIKAWSFIPKPVRLFLKPRMEREYLARVTA